MLNNTPHKTAVANAFSRAAATYDKAAVLQHEVGRRLLMQLDGVYLDPYYILDIGSGTGQLAYTLVAHYPNARVYACDIAQGMVKYAKNRSTERTKNNNSKGNLPQFVCADAQHLSFNDNSVDLIFSNLMLQWCADLPSVFKEMHRVLKPGGALFFSTLGLNTLHELKSSWVAVQPEAQFHTFLDMHDIGDVLNCVGFTGVVMHQEEIVVAYNEITQLLRDLRHVGARRLIQKTSEQARAMTGKQRFREFINAYDIYRDADNHLPATYEVIYGHATTVPSCRNTSR